MSTRSSTLIKDKIAPPAWAVRSLTRAITVVICVVVAVFFLVRLVPGDPAKMILGEYATPEAIAEMRHLLGLDLSAWTQFVNYISNLVTSGNIGTSIVYDMPTKELILDRAGTTLLLIALASLFSVILSLILALIAALNKDGFFDHLIRILPTITHGMPVFWIGLIFILFFSVKLGWFPVGGVGKGFIGTLHSLILPAITVSFAQIPSLVRVLRAQLLEIMESDFVVTLRAAGIPRRVIMLKHVLRNSSIPALMMLGVNLSYLIGGTLVIEQVFGLRGIGSLLFTSISNRDFPVIQGIALYCAVGVVIVSLVIDMISGILDPRTKGEQ